MPLFHPLHISKLMNKTLLTISLIIILAVVIYFALDAWQQSVTIYASTCETSGGRPLPLSVCKAILNYRYQQGD
ncbi:MAG: hypothetical protein ACKN9W_01870 [Methylococcus sp.]